MQANSAREAGTYIKKAPFSPEGTAKSVDKPVRTVLETEDLMDLHSRRSGNSGSGLIILVMLIAVSAIVMSNSISAFVESTRQTQLRIDQLKARHLARAGVVKAAWDWYKSNTTIELNRRWSTVDTTVAGNMRFKAGLTSSGTYLHSNYAYFTSTSDTSALPALVKNINTATNTSANTSIALTVPASGVAAGNYAVVSLAMDANRSNPSCTDTRGNTYTKHEEAAATNTAANVRVALFSAPIGTALTSGNTITCSWTGNCTAEAMSAAEYANVDGFDQSLSASAASGTAPSSGVISTNYGEELLVGAIATEGPVSDSFTAGSGWNDSPPTSDGTSLSTAPSNVTISPMYQIAATTDDYQADATITNRGWAAAIAGFKPPDRWVTSGSNRRLTQWQVYNINTSNSITLDKIRVSWTGGGSAQLNGFVLNGSSKWPGGTYASGSTIDVTDTTLASGAHWGGSNTYLQWNNGGPADPVTVICQFIFTGDSTTTDAKSHNVTLWDGDQGGGGLPLRRTFDVVSTGQVDQSGGKNFKIMRSVKAVISAAAGADALEIVDWDEEDHNIP